MNKILVPIKRVPDYEAKIKLLSNEPRIQTENIKWVVNPFDEIAVEEALRVKESKGDVEVVVATVGPQGASEQLRSVLAMGADRAIHVVTEEAVDSGVAALVLAKVFARDQYSLIIMGKQAVDSDASQTPQLVAAALDLPQATFASKLVVADDWASAQVTREVDGGLETIGVSLPAVVSTDLRLNTPRYTTLPNIVKAKKKPIEEITLDSLTLSSSSNFVVIHKLEYPPARKAGVKVQSVSELVDKLQNESKVI